MGNNQAASSSKLRQKDGYGFQVISVTMNSPFHQAGIEIFIDFVVDIAVCASQDCKSDSPTLSNSNDMPQAKTSQQINWHPQQQQTLSSQNVDIYQLIEQNENKELLFTFYSLRNRSTRQIKITPNKKWEHADTLLGTILREEQFLTYHEKTYKILRVYQNSPSHQAGLIENQDYLIGLTNSKWEIY